MKTIVFTTLLFAAMTSFGVSRIGGGKISSVISGFDLEVPSPFLNIQEFAEVIVASGPMIIQGTFPAQQFIQIREYSNYYAKQSTLTRAETEQYFTSRGLTKVSDVTNPCIDAYYFTSASTAGIVATWGEGKGVTLVGQNSYMVNEAVEQIIRTMTIEPGACSWK